jgi:hypothetical protein
MLVLQIMGAIAQFERIRAGLVAARAQGRVGAIPPCVAVPPAPSRRGGKPGSGRGLTVGRFRIGCLDVPRRSARQAS